jgi:hypothetical protein
MKSVLTFIVIVTIAFPVFSQNSTTGKTDEGLANKQNVVVVPFESKMYISDIDKDLAQKNAMSFHEIKAKFRAALDQNIFIKLKPYFSPFSFYTIDQQEAQKELSYIYNSVGYKYTVIEKEEVVKKENVGSKFIGKFKKKEKKQEYIEAGMQNGQIVSQVDNRDKYMNTQLSNPNLIQNLNKKYQAKYYIFINELDIKRGADNVYAAAEENYKREIKVHYTIIDDTGKEVSSGAIKTRFPSSQNDVDKIIRVHFPLIAETIVAKLVGGNTLDTKKQLK